MNYGELIYKIEKAKIDYYQTGRSELSDAEYDELVEQAEKLGYVETVGAAPVNHIDKIEHEHPMLSLDKCHTIAEVKKFIGNNQTLAMYKADGLTISATYINGELTRLETRGDGAVGNDIMFHAGSIEYLPKHINKDGKYVIDGECVILRKDFEEINEKMVESERYSHPRNLAAGSLNLLDPEISKKRHLRFYAWDIIEGGSSDYLSKNLLEAALYGFKTVPYDILAFDDDIKADSQIIEDSINRFRLDSDECGFPIDGVVFKYDNISYGKSLGMTGHYPKNAIAFKYKDELYETQLKSVEWQVGKSGQITPIAIFAPVEIDGSIVERASLSNLSVMTKTLGNNPYVGQKIFVSKMNMIIPKIVKSFGEGGEIYEC